MFSTVASSTEKDPEVWIRLVVSRYSSIQVMSYQEDDPDMYYKWLTGYGRSTRFRRSREKIVRRAKGSESTYVQGPKYSEGVLVVRDRVTSSTESPLVIEPGINRNHTPVVQACNYSPSANNQ